MVTAGVRSTGLLALTAAAREIHKAWATFGRVSAKEAEPNFRMTDNLPLAYLRSTLRPLAGDRSRRLRPPQYIRRKLFTKEEHRFCR